MKGNYKITVFTPTYNREYVLFQCYNSLCRQTNKNFEWLIVDDGSTDKTENTIQKWIAENKISIKYIKQKNSGKHIAHNTGVHSCDTDIFVCVDSDDYLVDNAIQVILENWDTVEDNNKIAGIIGLRGSSLTEPLGTRMPPNIKKCSINDLYYKYRFKGDTVLAFKTEILKKYLFPSFEGEKFVTEAVIYDQISQNYEMTLLDNILYICRYLPDGYSMNFLKLHKRNPEGYKYYLRQRIDFANSIKAKINGYSNYVAGCWRVGHRAEKIKEYNKLLYLTSLPYALYIHIKFNLKNKLIKLGVLK